ncbi:uncharacterized protein NPIL_591591 [Nephila pilipes]|uniref:Uncharacterized protein n=1 Tax=Nephila pilipes TaxID=299642 RepID=A0A8X6QPD3_NEPPI|nr:uncharacterized protein NPIL_591591 [Nephila pilipes]
MVLTWIFREIDRCRIFSFLCFIVIFFVSSTRSMEDDAPRPLVISLPINVAMPVQRTPSYEPEESAEEQQRVVTRTFNPIGDSTDYPQEDNQQESNNNNYDPRSSFLSWNPGNKFMVLQISDFIGTSTQQEPNESEEQERVEDTRVRKHKRPSQGSYDFEDYRRASEHRRRPEKVKKQRSSSASSDKKMKSKHPDSDDEEEEDGDVYGTDPVVHYLKERKRKNRRKNFDFHDMKQDEDEEFTIRDWWQY